MGVFLASLMMLFPDKSDRSEVYFGVAMVNLLSSVIGAIILFTLGHKFLFTIEVAKAATFFSFVLPNPTPWIISLIIIEMVVLISFLMPIQLSETER